MSNLIDLTPLDRHEKIALCVSGGKDSLALVYLLRAHLHRVTCYHLDTGDLLPETREIVDHVKSFAPNFVHIQRDILTEIASHGMPTDLLPHTAHPVAQHMGEHMTRLVSRYDCCWHNLMLPLFERVHADGNTMVIRGTKAVDMRRLPAVSGDNAYGVEVFLPLQGWTHDDVFAYLREVSAPISRIYTTVVNSPECARCTAWWGEKRAEYLRKHHPALWADYRARMSLVAQEIVGPVNNLRHELTHLELYEEKPTQ